MSRRDKRMLALQLVVLMMHIFTTKRLDLTRCMNYHPYISLRGKRGKRTRPIMNVPLARTHIHIYTRAYIDRSLEVVSRGAL